MRMSSLYPYVGNSFFRPVRAIVVSARNLQRLMKDNTMVSHSAGTVTTCVQTKAREASDLEESQTYAHEQSHPVNADEVEEREV